MPGIDPFYDVTYGRSRPSNSTFINQSHPLSKGLVGCYFLGDSQTRQVQNLANPNKFTLNSVSGPVQSVGGFNCPATKFVGASNQYLESTTVPLTAAPLSIVCWFNVDTAAVYEMISLNDNVTSTNNYFVMYGNTTDGTLVTAGAVANSCSTSTSEVNVAATSHFSANTWAQGVVTYTSATLRAAYCNGRGKATSATSRAPVGVVQLNVGATHANASIFGPVNGLIDHVLIYNRAITDQEVMWLYEQPFAMFEPLKRWGFISLPASGVAPYISRAWLGYV